MKILLITSKGITHEVKLDDEDFDRLTTRAWKIRHVKNGGYYALRLIHRNGKRPALYMHQAVIGDIPPNKCIDHINGDSLDNRKSNLRVVTSSQNSRNIGINKRNTSGSKGAHFDTHAGKWRAKIRVNGATISLGYFTNLQDATRAYDAAAITYHGEFARTNEMMQEQTLAKSAKSEMRKMDFRELDAVLHEAVYGTKPFLHIDKLGREYMAFSSSGPGATNGTTRLPFYHHDASCIYEAEAALPIKARADYANALRRVVSVGGNDNGDWAVIHATPAQRAEAMVIALGFPIPEQQPQ